MSLAYILNVIGSDPVTVEEHFLAYKAGTYLRSQIFRMTHLMVAARLGRSNWGSLNIIDLLTICTHLKKHRVVSLELSRNPRLSVLVTGKVS